MCARSCSKLPIAPMGKLRPDGRLTICSLFAGRRCLCQWWPSVNRELPDLLQHSYLCAHCFSKFPIAPMGFSHVLDICACRAAVSMSIPAQSQSSIPKCLPIKLPMCELTLKISHRPHGKVADVLAPTHACTTANASVTTGGACCRDLARFP